jgi:GntR family transcriptional regulator
MAPGELIPSEMELAARFKVSQGTVRKAIDELAAENLVMRRQGKGTFVATHAAQQVQYRFLNLRPMPATCRAKAAQSATSSSAAACARRRSGPRPGPAHRRRRDAVRRTLSFAAIPTILEDIWLPGNAFKGLTAEQMSSYQGPTYAMFELDLACAWCGPTRKFAPFCRMPSRPSC